MARGLLRTAFDQASYELWGKQFDIVNVMDYGAVGNGVHDDAVAFQRAVNATPTGGVLVIPSRRFYLGTTVNVPNPISVIGFGSGSILVGPADPLLSATNIGSGLTGDTNYGLMIRDIQMQITGGNTALALSTPYINDSVSPRVLIANVFFNGINNDQEEAYMTTLTDATGVVFESCSWQGSVFLGNPSGILLEGAANCRFTNCEFTYLSVGTRMQNDSGGQLTQGCYFVNCIWNGCNRSLVTRNTDNILIGNSMVDNTNYPINSYEDSNMEIANCYIGSFQLQSAIVADGSPQNLIVKGCLINFYSTGGAGIYLVGISAAPATNCIISGNIFLGDVPAQSISTVSAANISITANVFRAGNSSGTDILNTTPYIYDLWAISDNLGFNPLGLLTPPASPLASGTIYQNTFLVPITIYQPVYATTSGTAGTVSVAIGPSSTPATLYVVQVSGNTSSAEPAVCPPLRVPAGWYYSFSTTGATLADAQIQGE